MMIWDDISNNYAVKFLLTNRFNQDCLENLFSIIRAKGAQRDNPDAAQFRAAFRQVMVDMVMVPSKQANCEEDVDKFLCSLEQMKKAPHTPSPVQSPEQTIMDTLPFSVRSIMSVCTILTATEQEELSSSECNILAYIGGYITRKLQKKCCPVCQNKIMGSVDNDNPNHAFISEKSYGRLMAPSSISLP